MSAITKPYTRTHSIDNQQVRGCCQWLREKVTALSRRILGQRRPLPAPIAPETVEEMAPLTPPPAHIPLAERPRIIFLPPTIIKGEGLPVTQLNEPEWNEVADTTKAWSERALTKLNFASSLAPPRYIDLEETLRSSHHINNTVARLILRRHAPPPEGSEPWDSIFVCKDGEGHIQAIALHDTKEHKLAYLMTHPDNIPHPMNATQIRGCATNLIVHLAERSLRLGRSLRLNATRSSLPFYQKLNFTAGLIRNRDTIPMELTADKIRILLTRPV